MTDNPEIHIAGMVAAMTESEPDVVLFSDFSFQLFSIFLPRLAVQSDAGEPPFKPLTFNHQLIFGLMSATVGV